MLFAIDFDDTIASEHTHNKIAGVIKQENKATGHSETKENPEKQWELIKDIKPIGDYDAGPPVKSAWADNIKTMIDQGHKVAIVSFNSYGHLIPDYMEKVVGLPKEYVDKIEVVAFMPNNPPKGSGIPAVETEKADKNNHIRLAEKKLNFQESDHAIVLIDDSEKNIREAEKPKKEDIGFSTILADSEGTHLDKISTVLKESKEYQDNAKLEREQLEKEKQKEAKAPQNAENKSSQNIEQQTAAMAISISNEKDKQKFIASFEAEAAKMDMLVTKDTDRIIVSEKYLNKHNQIEPRPLCYFDTQRNEVKMMHSNNSISDYTKVFKLVANAVKSLFAKIKAFFSPNKAEKNKMKSALEEDTSVNSLKNAVNSAMKEEYRLRNPTFSDRRSLPEIDENYSRYNTNISNHQKPSYSTSQQYAMGLENKMSLSYKQNAEDYFHKHVPPKLYAKLSHLKKEWVDAMSPPIPPNTPNLGAVLTSCKMMNDMLSDTHQKKIDAGVKAAIKEEGKDFQHRPDNLTPQEKYEQKMKALTESTQEKANALVTDTTSGFNQNIAKFNLNTNEVKTLKTLANECIFADTPEKINAHIESTEPVFINNREKVAEYQKRNDTVGLSKVDNQYFAHEKQTLKNQEDLHDKYSNGLSNLRNDYQSKAQAADEVRQLEEKVQEKYPPSNSLALYDEVTQISNNLASLNGVSADNKPNPLFKIENEFQSNSTKLEEKLAKEGYTEEHPKEWYKEQFEKLYEDRDEKLNNLKSQTQQKIDVIEEKNELKAEEAKKEKEEKLDSTSSGPQLNQ